MRGNVLEEVPARSGGLIEDAPRDVQQETRILTAWTYINFGIGEEHCREGILWHDSSSALVMWQIHNAESAWHGNFELTEKEITVTFDACAHARQGAPVLEESCLVKTVLPETWAGKTRQGFYVQMQPICKYKMGPRDSAWKLDSQWFQATGWFYHEGEIAPAG